MARFALAMGLAARGCSLDLRSVAGAAAGPPIHGSLVGFVATTAVVPAGARLTGLLRMAASAAACRFGRPVALVALLAGARVRAVGCNLVARITHFSVGSKLVWAVARGATTVSCGARPSDQPGLLLVAFPAPRASRPRVVWRMAGSTVAAMLGIASGQLCGDSAMATGARFDRCPSDMRVVAFDTARVSSPRSFLVTTTAAASLGASFVRCVTVETIGVVVGLPAFHAVAFFAMTVEATVPGGLELMGGMAVGTSAVGDGE